MKAHPRYVATVNLAGTVYHLVKVPGVAGLAARRWGRYRDRGEVPFTAGQAYEYRSTITDPTPEWNRPRMVVEVRESSAPAGSEPWPVDPPELPPSPDDVPVEPFGTPMTPDRKPRQQGGS